MPAPDTTAPPFQTYLVGGAVRDELMGLPAGDRDWVVVGATPEQMLALGFQAVGKDFPVFLHPRTHEEHALARTERKTGPGYKGFAVHFSPDVTLEDDLLRRDLTINAIACATDGSLVDPFHGRADIEAKVFRHVSPAFREDPVRILRLARFAARFPDFTIAPETLALMRKMTAAGEVHALVAERVWQEISRGLMSQRPSRMLQVLADAHALPILLPHLPAPDSQPGWLAALDASAAADDPLPVRFAILMAGMTIPAGTCMTDGSGMETAALSARACDTEKSEAATSVTAQAKALRASNECTDAATRLVTELPGAIPLAARQWFLSPDRRDATALLNLFNRHDAWRRPERLRLLLTATRRLALPDHPSKSVGSTLTAKTDQGTIPNQAADSTPHGDSTHPATSMRGDSPPVPNLLGESPDTFPEHSVSNIIRYIEQALATAAAVDTGSIARQHQSNPAAIRSAIDEARREAIAVHLQATQRPG